VSSRAKAYVPRFEANETRILLGAVGQGFLREARLNAGSTVASLVQPRSTGEAVQPPGLAGPITGVTDPSIIMQGDTYYLFSTGPGIPIRASSDLVHWQVIGQVFGVIPAWARSRVPGATEFWAPDVSFFNGEYHLYYAISTFGSDRSVIGLATNPTLDPTASNYHWADQGEVIASIPGKTNWNAIDPNLLVAQDSTVWLAFGSQWSGIKLCRINPQTGKPARRTSEPGRSPTPKLFSIASRPDSGPIEAPFLFFRSGYYYLFASFGDCCLGAASTYKIMVGRSRSITGPFRDRTGESMAHGGGTLVLGSVGPYRGPGSNGLLTDGSQDWIVYHDYNAQDGGSPELGIRPLDWTSSGWPVVGAPLP
jgi:arabinan endo-1,5-alpha-L-arabinosidase